MRRNISRRAASAGLCAIALAPLAMARPFVGDGKKPGTPKKETIHLKIDETVGDLAKVPPPFDIKVEGVGLVIGLDNTGSDPSQSAWRAKLLDRLRKREVPHPEKILAHPSTSLVIVKGKIPAGITTEDLIDVDVELDPGSTTTSLAGGQLILTELFRVEYGSKGEALPQGQLLARVSGAVMTGSTAKPDDLKFGRILGGAKVKNDIPYALIIDQKRKSVHTAALIQNVVNGRFSELKGIDKEGMAKGQTDQYIQLKIPRNYHHNQYRYFQVVENLPIADSPALRAARLEKWGKDLLDPKAAGVAAIRLEGFGRAAVDTLKAALGNPHPQVRFFAAEALAYLGDESGVNVLADAAKNRPEFRAFAFAALAAMDQPASSMRLRELMSCADSTVRYGAFNALRITDPTDPFLGQVRVRNDEPEPEPEDGDALAMKIAAPRRKPPRQPDPFGLYVVDCEGPPLIHVAKTRRCEIVIFGKGHKLQTPAVLGDVGSIQITASDGDDRAQVSRIGSQAVDGPDQRVSTSLELAEIVRETANLGATYPEILSILQKAERQRNLPSAPAGTPVLVVDALPAVVAAYEEAQVAGRDVTAKTDPNLQKTGAEKAPRKRIIDRVFRRGNN